jgi:hypothetical protein
VAKAARLAKASQRPNSAGVRHTNESLGEGRPGGAFAPGRFPDLLVEADETVVRIAISQAAFESIAKTLLLGNVSFGPAGFWRSPLRL